MGSEMCIRDRNKIDSSSGTRHHTGTYDTIPGTFEDFFDFTRQVSVFLIIINTILCGYHVPGTNTPTHIVETPASFQTPLLEAVLGDLGRLPCLELATEPSPHSADGSSAAAIQPGGFSAAGLRKAPMDGPLARVPREQ